ncbi:hypothetical protein [Brachyspira pilosicoli]|uniref:Lipoprotein n=1 Tax=Brachyspira pilosicoli TaxID=52584 RepID=A0A5C8EXG6_BRAPL|nr:hypothetical protein [Brachyspira pilosicoli]TXJ41602.1 hypothetical protein EPJ72_06805 [Brachyspira pilosicoli]
MTKKILLLLFVIFIISIMFMSCKKFDTTATNVSQTGNYTSIDPILGQDYKLKVDTAGGTSITIGIADSTGKTIGTPETIDKLYQETGSSNYSFQNGVMSGNFSILSADQIKISFVRNTPPYLSVRDIICTSANNP